jgi:hypothetical protein
MISSPEHPHLTKPALHHPVPGFLVTLDLVTIPARSRISRRTILSSRLIFEW